MNDSMTAKLKRQFAITITSLALLSAVPLVGQAAPSNENHGSETGQENANSNGTSNSNINGIGTAPVPEASTWIVMAALVGAAAVVVHRRRRQLG